MSVKKVIESPENHEEGLTRRWRGLKSIRANYRGWERERSTGKWERQKVRRLKRKGEGNSS